VETLVSKQPGVCGGLAVSWHTCLFLIGYVGLLLLVASVLVVSNTPINRGIAIPSPCHLFAHPIHLPVVCVFFELGC
jgi:hypothetical protein